MKKSYDSYKYLFKFRWFQVSSPLNHKDACFWRLRKLSGKGLVCTVQTTFLKDLMTHLEPEKEGLLVLDFAENYSFLVQDAVQGFHWENSQRTVHPLVFYFCSPDRELQHQSFWCFSDGLKHTTIMVYAFLKVLIPTEECMSTSGKIALFFRRLCRAI